MGKIWWNQAAWLMSPSWLVEHELEQTKGSAGRCFGRRAHHLRPEIRLFQAIVKAGSMCRAVPVPDWLRINHW